MLITPLLPISDDTQAVLDKLQNDINAQLSYEAEVNRADALWNSKESSNAKKAAFAEIKSQLQKMAPADHYCCYCEQNEHGDIEHIYPKSLFPDKTFVWKNYVWSCEKCNSKNKLAKFKIFIPQGSDTDIDITPTLNRVYARPSNEDAVLINPRVDNPLEFLTLNLETGTFSIPLGASTRIKIRAEYTLDLLKLNRRIGLVIAREHAYDNFLSALKRYIQARNATNFQELEESMKALSPIDWTNCSFEQEQSKTCLAIQKSILTRTHQTVWKEMQRQATHHSKLTTLFQQAPEALTW